MKVQNKIVVSIAAVMMMSMSASTSQAQSASTSKGQSSESLTKSISVSRAQQGTSLAFWTRQKIADAPAMAMLIDTSEAEIDTAALEEEVLAEPVSTPAGTAEPGAGRIARAIYADDWAVLEAELALEAERTLEDTDVLEDEGASDVPADLLAGTSSIYTAFDVNRTSAFWKIYPHIWDGKLTFTTPSGGSSCSATVISGNNIVTAAHCVYDTSNNRFYSNWVFTPAFRNGNAPYGTFAAQFCTVLNAWVNLTGSYSINSWARHDVAVCTLGNNSAGQTINNAVGWAGRLWNAGNNQLVFNSGYPARDYNDIILSSGPAQYLRACIAESFQQTTQTLGSGCRWGRGISGGSWLVGYQPFIVNGQVNSVNSGLFIGTQNLYGARFNSNNIVPLCNTRGC